MLLSLQVKRRKATETLEDIYKNSKKVKDLAETRLLLQVGKPLNAFTYYTNGGIFCDAVEYSMVNLFQYGTANSRHMYTTD